MTEPNREDLRGPWGMTRRPYPALTGRPEISRQASGSQRAYRREIESRDFIPAPPYEHIDEATLSDDPLSISRAYKADAINISVEEAAILQSFPPEVVFIGTKSERGLIVGNAIPPLLAEAVLRELWSAA